MDGYNPSQGREGMLVNLKCTLAEAKWVKGDSGVG